MKNNKTIKVLLTGICLLFLCSTKAQKGDELLVYSIKGNVTVIEKDKESIVKIGRVLKPGVTIKTQKSAKLTMVCKEGKPLSITKEGIFPIIKWKDSCSIADNSMTSKYFQYIWDQLYVRSEDYKKEHPGETDNNERIGAPVRGEKILEIEFNEGLDIINYANGIFRLSWSTNIEYEGKYYFVLSDIKSGKQVYNDSLTGNSILIGDLSKYMRPGNSYNWSVAAGKSGFSNEPIINFLSVRKINQEINKIINLPNVPEEKAAQYFRMAYLLEKSNYLADAFTYYQKAVNASPDIAFFQEKLLDFKKMFQLSSL